MPAAAGLLVDARSLAKPPRFDGGEGKCRDWRFSFEAYLGLLGHGILEAAIPVAGATTAVRPTGQLGAGKQAVTRTLFLLLAQT